MDGTATFHPRSWEEGSTLEAFEPEVDELGKIKPKYKLINPGFNDRKSSGYMYLIIYGIIELDKDKPEEKSKNKVWCLSSFPLGVAKSLTNPEELLKSVIQLSITVRRTAGYDEKIVYGCQNIPPELSPWTTILQNGAVFPAIKVCSHIETIPLDKSLKMRPIFLAITLLTDAGVYKVPRNILDFRYRNAISFNLLVEIKIGMDLTKTGIKGILDEEGNHITTFMIHVGNFARRSGKVYSADYCRRKVDKMDLRFALGAIGGLSFHVRVAGKMSNALRAQLGYRQTICYSLMDTNPFLNKLMWKAECQINKVTAVFQPSVPREFKIYNDICIDHTGKILL
ncbi:matrix protein [Wufeng Rhinolophus pearsonii paramyxovirus 1]|uniref:Matrix protein n=1 Tax=Wufeng Rhinolophus pearsonii paramyxovirus 1 TaxID=2877502 RepID=A0AAE9BVM8_9MONO|nr:matrix protein [Wufeng Rhinolophus pearsonii paramyxovirus 1]